MSVYHSDTELFMAFRRGEESAIKQVYTLHFKPLCFFAHRITGNIHEAEDVVADTFIKMLHKKDDFQNLYNVKSFLYLATKNASLNLLKSRQRHDSAHQQLRFLNTEGEEATDLVNEELVRLEVLAAIHEEIEHLPARCKEIFKLIFFEGLSTEEIANQLNISPQTVRTQKARALELIKSELLKKNLLSAFLYLVLLFSSDRICV